ncbi:MAG: hypothetical protein HY585_00185 [Candidatus Omnitrophica bacterium]|nr:hypothetical protein [Candidatus Omnitrophota bacterium]
MGVDMQTALLLIALGFGFKIFAEASANAKRSVRQLGRIVGGFIMIFSLLGALCTVYYSVQCAKGGYSYSPMMGKMWGMGGKMCPITGKPLASEPTR